MSVLINLDGEIVMRFRRLYSQATSNIQTFSFFKSKLAGYFSLFIFCCGVSVEGGAFEKNRPLRAATLDYPPYEYLENGEPKGIAVEIIKEALRRTGVGQVVFEFYPWNRSVHLVRSGSSDILFNAGKNEARQQWAEYVESTLIVQKYVLFKRKELTIKVNSDFTNVNNTTISIRLGYLYGSGVFKQALQEDKFGEIFYSNSTKQSVDLLLGERIDLFVGDYLPIMHFINKNNLMDQIDVVTEPNGHSKNMEVLIWPTYILFSKKTIKRKYVNEVNAALQEMKADGFFDGILDKYTY